MGQAFYRQDQQQLKLNLEQACRLHQLELIFMELLVVNVILLTSLIRKSLLLRKQPLILFFILISKWKILFFFFTRQQEETFRNHKDNPYHTGDNPSSTSNACHASTCCGSLLVLAPSHQAVAHLYKDGRQAKLC